MRVTSEIYWRVECAIVEQWYAYIPIIARYETRAIHHEL